MAECILNGGMNKVLTTIDRMQIFGRCYFPGQYGKSLVLFLEGVLPMPISASLYYSGLIVDSAGELNNHYVVKDSILARSNYYYNLIAALGGVTSAGDFQTVMTALVRTSAR